MFRDISIDPQDNTAPSSRGDWLWEKAAMCAYVYGGFILPEFISEYKLYNTFKPGPADQGYYGACFVRVDEFEGKKSVDIVFSHRGTILNLNNIIDDLRIVLGYPPETYKVALNYITNTINELARQYGANAINCIENTGHSLGGVIADLLSLKLYATMSSQYDFYSTTFECPGSKAATLAYIKKGELPNKVLGFAKEYCQNFVNDINIINCCQEQVGINNKLLPQTYDFHYGRRALAIPDQSNCLKNFYYLFTYVADQHRIIKIYESIKDEADWEEDIPYPVGVGNSYRAYLDYKSRQHYWDSYMKELWKTDPKQREDFKGKYKNYVLHFIDRLDQLKRQVLDKDYTTILSDSTKLSSFGLFPKIVKNAEPELIKKEELVVSNGL